MTHELGLHRAEASTNLDNIRSQHVLRANGFTPYGVAHAHMYVLGAWHDSLLCERVLDDGPPPGRDR
jgi:ribosomal-protein-alanine N-acetyltransferase